MRLKSNQIEKVLKLLEYGQKEHADRLPELNLDKIEAFLEYGVYDPKVFIGVNKDVTAILILMVSPDMFSNRQSIKDVVWYSKGRGEGLKLLREAKKWVEGWGDSVYDSFLSTSMNDERADKLIGKLGLTKVGTVFSFKGDTE